ncbi:MAG: hypothetical protein KC944_04385 [Candidatus Omnitrophica bacterium]|nr:hypothetical protein [Candidatus Omnitrophota bacterium]
MRPRLLFFAIVFASSLVFSSWSEAQQIQQVIRGMQNRWNNIRDASAVIEIQTWNKDEGEKVNVFYGQIFYLAPLKVRLEYSPAPESATEPYLYPMGKNKYIYIHDGKQLFRYSASQDKWFAQLGDDPVINMVNQIADINNFNVDRFMSIYQVADVRSERLFGKIPTYLLRAEPKSRSGQHPRQLLWIHQRTYLPVEAVMAREQNEVSCFFHDVDQNPGLSEEIFSME